MVEKRGGVNEVMDGEVQDGEGKDIEVRVKFSAGQLQPIPARLFLLTHFFLFLHHPNFLFFLLLQLSQSLHFLINWSGIYICLPCDPCDHILFENSQPVSLDRSNGWPSSINLLARAMRN